MSKKPPYTASQRGPAEHELRNQIVATATEHFRLYGYEKTTVSDLAKAVGYSKAYIYKFFESKQAIGEVICGRCLADIESACRDAVAQAAAPPDKLRRLFKALTASGLRLFFHDRRLYDIAAAAAGERWQSTRDYDGRLRALIRDIVREGRESGDFERRTPLDETVDAIQLVLWPYTNPLMLQHHLDTADDAPMQLCSLVLRSLSP